MAQHNSKDTCNLVAQGAKEHGLYRLSALLVHGDTSRSWLWHERFEHINYGTLSKMAKTQMVDGLPLMAASQRVYQDCMEGKQHRGKFSYIGNFQSNRAARASRLKDVRTDAHDIDGWFEVFPSLC